MTPYGVTRPHYVERASYVSQGGIQTRLHIHAQWQNGCRGILYTLMYKKMTSHGGAMSSFLGDSFAVAQGVSRACSLSLRVFDSLLAQPQRQAMCLPLGLFKGLSVSSKMAGIPTGYTSPQCSATYPECNDTSHSQTLSHMPLTVLQTV